MTEQGHNNPPANAEVYEEKIAELEAKAAGVAEVELTEANTGAMRDLIGLGDELAKQIEKTRKEEKEPFLEGGKAIDSTYNPLKDKAKSTFSALKSRLQAYLTEQKRKADEVRRAAEAKAAEEAAKAAALKDDPLVGEQVTQSSEDAEAEARLAAAEAKAKATIKGTSGMRAMGLRTKRTARVVDAAKLVAAYADHPDVIATAERLANADIRAAGKDAEITIPGIELETEETLV